MQHILDLVAGARKTFRPTTVPEVFALRLAQKLNDAPAVKRYIDLTDRHGPEFLVATYQLALASSWDIPLAERFARILANRIEQQA